MPFYGTAILCTDDPAVRSIVNQVTCPITSYGMERAPGARAINVRAVGAQMHFTVQRRNGVVLPDLDVVLNLADATTCSMPCRPLPSPVGWTLPDAAAAKPGRVQGRRAALPALRRPAPARRGGIVTVMDDYGHHPVEMAATLAAARGAF